MGYMEEAEILQRKMGRFILGHNHNSNNQIVNQELGWWKLKDRRDYLRIRFWGKIINLESNRIPYQAYRDDINNPEEENWAQKTKKIMEKWGLEMFWEKQEKKNRKGEIFLKKKKKKKKKS